MSSCIGFIREMISLTIFGCVDANVCGEEDHSSHAFNLNSKFVTWSEAEAQAASTDDLPGLASDSLQIISVSELFQDRNCFCAMLSF